MFCKSCGKENKDYALYCWNDGLLLYGEKDGEEENFIIEKGNNKFCRKCGAGLKYAHNFCGDCGEATYDVSDINFKKENMYEEDAKKNIFKDMTKGINKGSLIDLAKKSLMGFGILIVYSIILSIVLKGFLKKTMLMGGAAEEYEVFKKIINVPWIMIFINGMSGKIGVKGAIEGISMNQDLFKTEMGLAALYMAPVLIFMIIGMVGNKKRKLSIRDMGIVSIVYGLLMIFLSLFIRSKGPNLGSFIEEFLPFGGLDDAVLFNIKLKISRAILFLKSFILSFIGLNIGTSIISLVRGSSEYREDLSYKNPSKSFLILLFGVVFTIVISFLSQQKDSGNIITTGAMNDMFGNGSGYLNYMVQFTQVLLYTFLLINGASYTVNLDYKPIEVSLLDLNRDAMINTPWNYDKKIFLYIGILFIIFLFFLYGRNYKKKRGDGIIYSMVTPAYYALILGTISYLINISIKVIPSIVMTDGGVITVGFPILGTVVKGFIVAGLGTAAGYFITAGQTKEAKSYE